MWFYKIETDKKHKSVNVTWNTMMTYLKNGTCIIGVIACLFNVIWLAAICLAIIAISLIIYMHHYGDLIKLLHDHERNKSLKYKGSQYSFKNPLVVTIPMVRAA